MVAQLRVTQRLILGQAVLEQITQAVLRNVHHRVVHHQEAIALHIPVEVHNLLLDRNLLVVPLVLLQVIALLQEVHRLIILLVVVAALLEAAIQGVVHQEVVVVVAHRAVVVEVVVADKKDIHVKSIKT